MAAILFLTDIDNISFKLALPERVRARVEAVGRVELGDEEASALVTMKVIHVCLVVLVVLSGVWAADDMPFRFLGAFLLGRIVQVLMAPEMARGERVKRVGTYRKASASLKDADKKPVFAGGSLGAALCGFVGWVALLVAAQQGTA